MDLGSGIRKKPIPDPGSRGQKGTGSRIRNTGQPRYVPYTVIKLKWAHRYRDLYTLYLLIRSDSAKVKKFDGIFSPALKVRYTYLLGYTFEVVDSPGPFFTLGTAFQSSITLYYTVESDLYRYLTYRWLVPFTGTNVTLKGTIS